MKSAGVENKKSSLIRALVRVVALLLLVLLVYSCASIVAPTGGPRDVDPPQVVRSTPPNFSTHFEGGQVRIFFDEFVQLADLRSKFLISPPLEELPQVRIRGRSIIMDVDEPLRENTTYNFFFGDAIQDITENNPLRNFQYVVSTGDFVDSLSVRGRVIHSFSLEPMEGIFVMLYDDFTDSIPYLQRPVYLSMTDQQGYFTINNMAGGEYKIFALQDLNANFLYDLPDEQIAFQQSPVIPVFIGHTDEEQEEQDAEADEEEDEAGIPLVPPAQVPEVIDTVSPGVVSEDSLQVQAARDDFYALFMFQEADTVQRVISSSLVRRGLAQIIFRIPTDSAWVREIREPFDGQWHIRELMTQRDTLRLWLLDVQRDSLFLEVGDGPRVLDTLRLSTVPRQVRGRTEPEDLLQPLGLSINASRTRGLPFFQPLRITAENPIEEWNLSRLQLFQNDTIPLSPQLEFADRASRAVETSEPLEQGQNYRLTLLPGTFTDIFGLENDTLDFQFRTTSPEDYGMLIVNLELPHEENQFILQIINSDGQVVRERFIYSDGVHNFRNLMPGNFEMRLIDDVNSNGRWDTGNYLRGIQPEPVYIFTDPIQLRMNWEMELSWSPQSYL